jgi:hypothetical protein
MQPDDSSPYMINFPQNHISLNHLTEEFQLQRWHRVKWDGTMIMKFTFPEYQIILNSLS